MPISENGILLSHVLARKVPLPSSPRALHRLHPLGRDDPRSPLGAPRDPPLGREEDGVPVDVPRPLLAHPQRALHERLESDVIHDVVPLCLRRQGGFA